MTLLYNTTNATTIPALMQYVQSTTHVFAELIVIAVFFVAFVALKRYETGRALPPALFIATFTAIIFYMMGMLADVWVYGGIVALGASVAALFFKREYGG